VSYPAGALVHARNRDWVVQPGSDDAFLLLKPLGGRDDETTGLVVGLETVEEATFRPPDPADVGDARSAGLLRDAVRLSFRSSSGPFRSFGRIAVEPRPYQLVPLLMALKLEPVRLLIADDVGVGKTVEAGLIARELLDRGEALRLAVLCPPHLAEQWQTELREKFHIDPVLVLPSTASRLDRTLGHAESIFDRHPFTVVSMDFIKAERRRDDFLRSAPELVIVDEAHTCADSGEGRGGRHQRHRMLQGLARDATRHLVLVTATPHSGKEEAFRSLLSLLKPEFARLPDDLAGQGQESLRRELAQHFIQRKRGDIRRYLDADTPFPERDDADMPYGLAREYKELFEKVLRYARESLRQDDGTHRQRVRWWAMLGLLRALASSPAAAAATLRNRAAPSDTETVAEADEVGRRTVFDQMEDDAQESLDVTPGGQVEGGEVDTSRRRLLEFARDAEALKGAKDTKLSFLNDLLRELLRAGRAPIVFCRFIETAEYVAEQLRGKLGKDVQVAAVTGTQPPEEREIRVAELAQHERRVLVATDCLSEGINLQSHFDAVIHYDLSWNPTRHEQREGRVDRYGQATERVVVRTMYGVDNQIDGIVLDVLLKKHKTIRSSLGVSVPVPADNDQVVEAIFEGLLLRGHDMRGGQQTALFEDLDQYIKPRAADFARRWDAVADREKRSRTVFAQETIRVEDVARELESARSATGGPAAVQRFILDAARLHGVTVGETRLGAVDLDLSHAPATLREAVRVPRLSARFELPVREGEVYLSRTHPVVEGFTNYVLDTALDPLLAERAKRAGAMRTKAVMTRTTLLLARFRYHVTTTRGDESWQTLAEETFPLAFEGAPEAAEWLRAEQAEALLEAVPAGNIAPPQMRAFLERAAQGLGELHPKLEATTIERAAALLDAHRRVRTAAGAKGLRYRVDPLLPADVLGLYVYLPA
jgi:superfamily II DNA or RNA helicase